MNANLEAENHKFRLIYNPLLAKLQEFVVKMPDQLEVGAFRQGDVDNFPTQQEKILYGFYYKQNVQVGLLPSEQHFSLSVRNARPDEEKPHKVSFDVFGSTWGIENASVGYSYSQPGLASIGVYYNSGLRNLGAVMWTVQARDHGEYQSKSAAACQIDVKDKEVSAVVAGRYQYEDMTDPDSTPKVVQGRIDSRGNMQMSLGIIFDKVRVTLTTEAELSSHETPRQLALPIGVRFDFNL